MPFPALAATSTRTARRKLPATFSFPDPPVLLRGAREGVGTRPVAFAGFLGRCVVSGFRSLGVYALTHRLTHPLTHSLTRSYSPTHSLTHSLIHSLTHSLTHYSLNEKHLHTYPHTLTHTQLTHPHSPTLTHTHTPTLTYTHTHTLTKGREIREKLDEHVAQLYSDLDGGFSHLAWLLPGWLPLPSFRYTYIHIQSIDI